MRKKEISVKNILFFSIPFHTMYLYLHINHIIIFPIKTKGRKIKSEDEKVLVVRLMRKSMIIKNKLGFFFFFPFFIFFHLFFFLFLLKLKFENF